MRLKRRCGAHTRSTGKACQAKAPANGRCRNYGGLYTGPRTEAGKRAIGIAARSRLAAGDQAKLLAGFRAWLERRRTVSSKVALP